MDIVKSNERLLRLRVVRAQEINRQTHRPPTLYFHCISNSGYFAL